MLREAYLENRLLLLLVALLVTAGEKMDEDDPEHWTGDD